MAVLHVGTALAHRRKAHRFQQTANFAGLEDRNRARASTHCDALRAHKLGIKLRLAVLQQDCHDLAQVDVQFIERGCLRMGPWKARHVAYEQTGHGIAFHDGGKILYGRSPL